MKWKRFDEEMPKTCTVILIRYIINGTPFRSEYVKISMVKRPYEINKEKYSQNYYQIKIDESKSDPWVDLDKTIKEEFEWLDPFEDRKTSELRDIKVQ